MEPTSVDSALETELEKSIHSFRRRFNENARVKKLIKNWDRSVMVESIDTKQSFSMIIEDLEMPRVEPGMVEADPPIHLQAEEEVLIEMFTGAITPASALMDGSLAVFSTERDKVKLEAIAMVIWGV